MSDVGSDDPWVWSGVPPAAMTDPRPPQPQLAVTSDHGTTAAMVPTVAAAVVSSACGGSAARQWVADNVACQGGHAKTMPPEHAAALILDPSFQPGPRPINIAALPASASGWVFKETSSSDQDVSAQGGNARRAFHRDGGHKPDYWHGSGGSRNQKDLPAGGLALVRRRCGTIDQRQPCGGPASGWGFSYREYSLLDHTQSPPGVDRRIILYHVLPKHHGRIPRQRQQQQQPALPSRAAGSGIRSWASSSSGRRQLRGGSERGVVTIPMREFASREAVVASGAPLLSLRAPTSAPALDGAGGGGGGGGGESTVFTRFEKGGCVLGSIGESGRGVSLHSAGGDVAEWHRVCHGCGALEEGDVVGLRNGEISRLTEVSGAFPSFLCGPHFD
eukprot:COSAG01_NODE_1233_length_11110_cov_13.006902_4_plen_389_part_00